MRAFFMSAVILLCLYSFTHLNSKYLYVRTLCDCAYRKTAHVRRRPTHILLCSLHSIFLLFLFTIYIIKRNQHRHIYIYINVNSYDLWNCVLLTWQRNDRIIQKVKQCLGSNASSGCFWNANIRWNFVPFTGQAQLNGV